MSKPWAAVLPTDESKLGAQLLKMLEDHAVIKYEDEEAEGQVRYHGNVRTGGGMRDDVQAGTMGGGEKRWR